MYACFSLSCTMKTDPCAEMKADENSLHFFLLGHFSSSGMIGCAEMVKFSFS